MKITSNTHRIKFRDSAIVPIPIILLTSNNTCFENEHSKNKCLSVSIPTLQNRFCYDLQANKIMLSVWLNLLTYCEN